MNYEEDEEIKKIIDNLSDATKMISFDKEENKDIFNIDEKEENYLKEYSNLYTFKLIKQNPQYYLSKWSIILNHLINLDDFFYYLQKDDNFIQNVKKEEKEISNESENCLNIIDSLSENESTSKNKSKGVNSSLTSINKSKSLYDSILNLSNSKIDNDLYNFKLNYFKKSLNIYENEIIDGDSYERYAKRTFYLMLILLKVDKYEFKNPKKIFLEKLKNYYFENFMEKITFSENKDLFEIDLIINNFSNSDLILLIDKFKNHFFFVDQLKLNENDSKINIISEICRSIIFQAQRKLAQEKIYLTILKILEGLRNKNINPTKGKYKGLFESLMIDNFNNENIFILITDGSYILLKISFEIVNNILKIKKNENVKQNEDENENEARSLIKKEIEVKKKTINNIIGNKLKYLENLIYNFYQILDNLRKNNIRHCIFYLGEETGNEYEDAMLLFSKNLLNINKTYNDEDIIINFNLKKNINELISIRGELIQELKNYVAKLYKKLENNKNMIKRIFNDLSINKKDFLHIKLIINSTPEIQTDIQQMKNSKILSNLFIEVEKYELKNLDKILKNSLKENKFDIIIIIAEKIDIQIASISKKYGNDVFLINTINENELKNVIVYTLNNNLDNYKRNFIFYPKSSFKNTEKLNFENLSEKINEELGVEINIKVIKNYMDIRLDKEIENLINKIFLNVQTVKKLIKLDKDDKIESLKMKNNENLKHLEENIKASVFYDFVYYSFLKKLYCDKFYSLYSD